MRKLFLLLVPIFFMACTSEQEKNIANMKEEVMAIHDEVMPKMGELRKVEKAIRVKADSIATVDSVSFQKHVAAADALSAANEGMMDWMRGYEPNFEGSPQEIEAYLEGQKTAVQKVRDDMLNSLDQGRKILENQN